MPDGQSHRLLAACRWNAGKRQLFLKDLSIEADASSFVFQGIRRKRPITCHRYPVRQMRTRCQFLFLLRKQPHKSMKCRKYSGKTRVRCAICRKTKRCQRQAAMFGFSAKCRHFAGNESWRIRRSSLLSEKRLPVCAEKTKITAQTKNYGRLEEFLSQLRYESEVLFRKLLGKRTVRPHPPWCSDGKKGMDSEVKALYQGAGISHLLAISGLHLSLIGAGLFGLLKKYGFRLL